MNQVITLTVHAEERLHQRSSETLDSLTKIISDGKFVPIGKETGSNRQHFLFYSQEDQIWHVIIIDVRTRQIITLLPIDFHENISWRVSDEALREAKSLAEGKNEDKTPAVSDNVQSVIRIVGVYFQSWNNPKWLNLGSWPFNHNLQLSEFVPDEEFWSEIESRIQNKQQPVSNIEGVFIYRRKSADRLVEIDPPLQWVNGQQVSGGKG